MTKSNLIVKISEEQFKKEYSARGICMRLLNEMHCVEKKAAAITVKNVKNLDEVRGL